MKTNPDKVLSWILNEMQFNTWYRVRTEEQLNVFFHLYDLDLINNLEFDDDYSRIRKINLDGFVHKHRNQTVTFYGKR